MAKIIQYNIFGEQEVAETKRGKQDKFADYSGFVDKFKPKLTTDDCYTPEPVYKAIRDWVDSNIMPLDGVCIVRPFYPGGDYINFEYPEGCVVLDNPPFSILANIRRFYHSRGIRYFLFCPGLTMANSARELWKDSTFIITRESIVYHNGASVATGFVTNIECGGLGVWVSGGLSAAIKAANKVVRGDNIKELQKCRYPDCVVSPATLRRLAVPGVELKIKRERMSLTTGLASQKAAGKNLFGGGWLISEKAAAEKAAAEKAAAEKAAAEKAAAEKAAAEKAAVWVLSEDEKRIVANLGMAE